MKNKFILVMFGLILVTGCGTKEEGSFSCNLKSTNSVQGYALESVYKVNYSGDVVKSVETKEVVTSEEESILNYFEKSLNNTYSSASENYGGYDFNITKTDNQVSAITNIDYTKMDMDKYVSENTAMKSYTNDKNQITVENLKKLYESLGAICE